MAQGDEPKQAPTNSTGGSAANVPPRRGAGQTPKSRRPSRSAKSSGSLVASPQSSPNVKKAPAQPQPTQHVRKSTRHAANAIAAVPTVGPATQTSREEDRAIAGLVRDRFVQVGQKYYFKDGARAFTDHGARLSSPSENTVVIHSLIEIAKARGWQEIRVKGTEKFRREAWAMARTAGLHVRGYKPSLAEQERALSQPTATKPPATTVAPRRSDQGSRKREPHRRTTEGLVFGTLVDFNAARHPLNQDSMSYYVRIDTPAGNREFWGVDLERALKRSETQPKIGDEIGLRRLEREPVEVKESQYDDTGRPAGHILKPAYRNTWLVESRDFFRERLRMSRTFADTSITAQEAVKRHPELAGVYLQLKAVELAAGKISSATARGFIIDTVRQKLADNVGRGLPLPKVPLKDPIKVQPPVQPPHERAPAPVRE